MKDMVTKNSKQNADDERGSGRPRCPVCGNKCISIGVWHEHKGDNADEFRTIVHEKDGFIVTESCTEVH